MEKWVQVEYVSLPSREDLESLVGLILIDFNEYGERFKVLEVNITSTGLLLHNIGSRENIWYTVNSVMKMYLLPGAVE